MQKVHICHYVAYNSPQNAKKILEAWGVPVKNGNKETLAESLKALLKTQGEPVLMDLANLHPDKELILHVEELKNSAQKESKQGCSCNSEKKSGACGCSSFSGGGAWNANEGAFYSVPRNPMLDEFQVYGFDGSKPRFTYGEVLMGGVGALLLYLMWKGNK